MDGAAEDGGAYLEERRGRDAALTQGTRAALATSRASTDVRPPREDRAGERPPLFSVGYAGFASGAELANRLREAGVEVLVDVRARASSRRRGGFAKTALAAALADAGIGYRHAPALGNPPRGRELYRAGRIAEGRALYERQLPEGALEELAALAATRRCALLCVESERASCHRDALIDALRVRGLLAADVIELAP